MGYAIKVKDMDEVLKELQKEYCIYAPKVYKDGHTFTDLDLVRYGQIDTFDEIVFDRKSAYSFKEVLLPITQTLFYYTEDTVKEAEVSAKKSIIFLRSCDLHAVKRLDEVYIHNGFEDSYYKKLRERVKFILIGCQSAFDNCFCVDMETNKCNIYDCSMEVENDQVFLDNKYGEWDDLFRKKACDTLDVVPKFVSETKTKVNIPDGLTLDIMNAKMWEEYDSRCINCGRCNFVCPTCTCFTMQDIFYTDNGKVGERRRVWASCMVDGFTEVAGGGSYRQKNGQRMRFRVLHKIYDYKKRFHHHMCTGCGRCDDICPEYISFSNCINKLGEAIEEVAENE